MTIIADALKRFRVSLHGRRPDDEEFVEKCRKWLRREKATRVAMLVCVAFLVVSLVFAVMRPFAVFGHFASDKTNLGSFAIGFVAGAPFWCALCSAIWGLILVAGGHPRKTRELMLRFHDELKGERDTGQRGK